MTERLNWTELNWVAQSCLTLCESMNCSTPGLPVHHQLLESTQTHIHWVNDAIQQSHPLLSPSPPALNFPSIKVFSNESTLCIRWPKRWSFSFKISPSNEHPELISREAQSLIIFKFINLCPAPWFLQPRHLSHCRHIHIWWTCYDTALMFPASPVHETVWEAHWLFPRDIYSKQDGREILSASRFSSWSRTAPVFIPKHLQNFPCLWW